MYSENSSFRRPDVIRVKLPFIAMKIVIDNHGTIHHKAESFGEIDFVQTKDEEELKTEGVGHFMSFVGFNHREIIPRRIGHARRGTNAFAIGDKIWVFGQSVDFGGLEVEDWDPLFKYLELQYPGYEVSKYSD